MKENLHKIWKDEEEQSMKGWNFSHIDGRFEEEQLPFTYTQIVLENLQDDYELLDMGTGGGELVLSLNHPYNKTSVTEGYEPNIKYCKEHLEPLGINVIGIDKSGELPFEDNSFDIIINKHSSYDIKEVKRVLKNNGLFITQQVGNLNNRELSRVFIEDFELSHNNNLINQKEKFVNEGFKILNSEEYYPKNKFYDIGALCFFCKIIVWEFPDFSVDKYYDELLKLHKECEKDGFIEIAEHRYLLVCVNNK